MVKFSKDVSNLNYKIVGRKNSVKREVKLLLGEWDEEKTHIKKKMWNIKNRNPFFFVFHVLFNSLKVNFSKNVQIYIIKFAKIYPI